MYQNSLFGINYFNLTFELNSGLNYHSRLPFKGCFPVNFNEGLSRLLLHNHIKVEFSCSPIANMGSFLMNANRVV